MTSKWVALLLGAVAAWGCEPSNPASDPEMSPAEARAYVDSLNQGVDELNVRLRARILDDSADFIGRVDGLSSGADSVPSLRVTIRYVVPSLPEAGQGRMSFELRGEGALWRQNRTVLPLDSLKRGDVVKVWTQGRGVFSPTNPPLVAVRAVQRIDSLPLGRDSTRLSSRAPAPPKPMSAGPPLDSVVLERSGCFGGCVPYRLRIGAGGEVRYESHYRPDRGLVVVDTVASWVMDSVYAHAVRAAFWDLPDRIPESPLCPGIQTEYSIVAVTIFGHERKQVVDFLNCPRSMKTDALRQFSSRLDSLAGSHRWISPLRRR